MRLLPAEIQIIKQLTLKYFGAGARVSLFGSRVDDTVKGGDIDLFISDSEPSLFTVENKIRFLVELKRHIGNQKIDLVFDTPSTQANQAFYQSLVSSKIYL